MAAGYLVVTNLARPANRLTMPKLFYITTPIYYVNDVPHLGHAYTTLAADTLARWKRLHGDPVYFLTGTDEHGQNVLRAAEAAGVSGQEWVDSIVPRYHEVWDQLDITNDDFIRTTETRHTDRVQEFVQDLMDNGAIYSGTYAGLYCVSCEEFKEESDLVDGRLCAVHEKPVEFVEEENWFFKLSAYADDLLRLYEERPEFVRPEVRLNEVRSFVEGGLKDVSLSRSSFDWGIEVPWDPSHVIYVWIDALLNYITAAGYGADEAKFKELWPADVQFVGKDILRFHAVIWPAMLIAAGVEPPKTVWAHGWLLVGGKKMSKTALTGIHPDDLVSVFGRDALRYYLLREVSFGHDGNISWESMHERYTTDLANELGNLVNRTLNMVGTYCDGIVPEAAEDTSPEGSRLVADRHAAIAGVTEGMEAIDFRRALEDLWMLVRSANRYVAERAPWTLAKEGKDGEVARVLYQLVDALRAFAVLGCFVLPDTCRGIWERLGLDGEPQHVGLDGIAPGAMPSGGAVSKGEVLFPRVELDAG